MALAQRAVSGGLIHHSDRGKQYCSNVYVQRLRDVGAYKSHVHPWSANGKCVCGKLYQDTEVERSVSASVPDFDEAQARLKTFLEDVYNTKRLHSSLDDVPPVEFELQYALCLRLSGLDFLGALYAFSCQSGCQPLVEGRLTAGRTALQAERSAGEGAGQGIYRV
jgi:hypothetical protein